jgi:hypothetical protein
MANTQALALTAQYIKLWEQCWDPKVCVHVPFDSDACVGAHVCVRLVEDNGGLFIEGEINGHTARYGLANGCIPAFAVGPATLDVCVTQLDVQGGALRGLTLTVKLCVDANIGPIHLGHCWDLFSQEIKFSHLTAGQLQTHLGLASVDPKAAAWNNKFVSHSVATLGQDALCPCHCGA